MSISPKKESFQKLLFKITLPDKEKGILNLKKAFLEESAILFENFEIKIGCKTNLLQSKFGPENNKKGQSLLVNIYYCNKNKFTLEECVIKFDFSRSLENIFFLFELFYLDINNIKVYPLNFEFSLPGNSTKRQDFLIENLDFNDEIVLINFSYK